MYAVCAYPVITTEHFAETLAFYEDHFGFVPFYETEGYARLRHKDVPTAIMVVIRVDHEYLPQVCRAEARSQILTLATDNIDATYDELYHDGLEIIKEPTVIDTGIKHFMVADPNNPVFINVVTPPQDAETGCCGQC